MLVATSVIQGRPENVACANVAYLLLRRACILSRKLITELQMVELFMILLTYLQSFWIVIV